MVREDSLKEVAISEFRAKCLALLEQVRPTKKPFRVTRFGKPVAEIVPPSNTRCRIAILRTGLWPPPLKSWTLCWSRRTTIYFAWEQSER
jgi:prevent-host-death family protein